MTSLVAADQLSGFVNYPIPTVQAELTVEMASGVVRAATAQQIDWQKDDVLVISPTGPYVFLPEIPVSDVSRIEILNTSDETWSDFDPDNYRWIAKGIIYVDHGSESWPTFADTVRVTYTHGYTDIPHDLQSVTLAIAARIVANPTRIYVQTTGGISQTFQRETHGVSDLFDTELQILGRYRNPVTA